MLACVHELLFNALFVGADKELDIHCPFWAFDWRASLRGNHIVLRKPFSMREMR